jgi:two-component system NtrC family sensor kinase
MSGECILVIDDSREIVKHLTEHVLPTFAYKTLYAFDGQSGLKLIREKKPDLVMLDYNLPEMTGIDVLQQMAQESISTPVVLMTGYGSEQSAIEAFRLGARDYLIKPFTVDEIVETIDRALVETRLLHDKQELAEQLRRVKVEMSRQTHEMNTLSSIGKAITSLLSVDKVLERVLEAAIYLSNAEESTIWLPDATGTQLHAYEGKAQDREATPLPELSIADSQVGQVIRTGRPLRQSVFSGKGIKVKTGYFARAVLYVPLELRSVTMGVLGVSNRAAFRSFSKRDEFLLSFLADYAAIALENARVLQAADQALAARLEELNTLIDITRTITSSLDLDEVVRVTIKQVHDSWDIEASSIWLLDESKQSLHVLANVGTPADILAQIEIPLSEGLVGYVAKTGKWIYTNDVATHPLHYRQVDKKTGFKTRSILSVPLMFRGQVMGALQLLNKTDGDFDDQDVERAITIAAAVAIAVTNALLFTEAEARKEDYVRNLKELEQAKDDFAVTVAHDVRTPLTTITGFVANLREAGSLNEEQAAWVERILQTTDHMAGLVDGVLELARLDATVVQQQLCHVPEIVAEVLQEMQGQALARHISLVLTAEEEIGPVRGDPAQLRRAITNLVDNAIKYSPEGQRVQIDISTGPDSVLIKVCDHGMGITPADLPHIFDKFYRGRGSSEADGIGLGLTLVQAITKQHGGQVWVESQNGNGSTFSLRLPVTTTNEERNE